MPRKTKKTQFWSIRQGCKNMSGHLKQAAKELSTIPAYAVRDLTGQPHNQKPTCKLKKGWFE